MIKFTFIYCFIIWIAHSTFLPLAFSASFFAISTYTFYILAFSMVLLQRKGKKFMLWFLSTVFLRGSMWLLLSFFSLVFFFFHLNSRTQRCAVSLDFQCLLKRPRSKVCQRKYLSTFMDTLLVKMSIYWDQRRKFIMPLGCLTKDYQCFVSFFLLK